MKLQGDPSLRRSKISLEAMFQVLRIEGKDIIVEFNGIKNCLETGQ